MKFLSTHQNSPAVSLSEALELGLAPDGGLYVPENFPQIRIENFKTDGDFSHFARQVLAPFFEGDALAPKLEQLCKNAFSFPILLKTLPHPTSVLELFHGPTAAFKDVGARFLAECFCESQAEPQTILVATSGDTGGAVAAAFFDRPAVEVIILFPKNGVSARQQKQLTCWGKNIHAYAVDGSFDDCQRLVKSAFSDSRLRARKKISSANSINLGRLLPQACYYAWASVQYLGSHSVAPSFIIPSGNLGNATAALWAKKMGFPIDQIGMATNANAVVPHFLNTGVWKPGATISTLANAMDVGNPSNMERVFKLDPKMLKESVFSKSVTDEEIKQAIRSGEKKYGEIWCPHTATAVHLRETRPELKNAIVVATAHPAKFETIVEPLIGHPVEVPESLRKLLSLESSFETISAGEKTFKELIG